MKCCSVEGCERKTKGRRLCGMHWNRLHRVGSLELPKREYFPSAPLIEIVEQRGGPVACTTDRLLHKAYQRAQTAGRVTTDQADRLALRMIGVHPWEIWPEWFPDESAGLSQRSSIVRA